MNTKEIMPISDTQREVADEPSALEHALNHQLTTLQKIAHELAMRSVDRLYLLGSGDSLYASQAASLAFACYSGVSADAIQAYEFAVFGHPMITSTSAIIVVSSSGRPTSTWDALDRALQTPAYVIGISDIPYPGNPFLEKSHAAIVPGAVKKGWPAQTTTVTVGILIELAILLGRERGFLSYLEAEELDHTLRTIPEKMRLLLQEVQPIAKKIAPELANQVICHFVGGGSGYAAACVGSALWAAGPQIAGMPLEVEEFNHALRISVLSRGDILILIAPDGATNRRNLDTAQVVKKWGGKLLVLTNPSNFELLELADSAFILPDVPEPINPLVTLPVLQQLSIEVAMHRVATGYQRLIIVPA
jgi:glutamine---fructose-6-phosphate transaminase (isomerizing)